MGFIGEHKNDIIQLVMAMLIGYLLYKMVFLVAYRTYIVANWSDYRCNPMFMPLASMLNIPDPNAEKSANGLLTVSANLKYCVGQTVGGQMGKYTKTSTGAVSALVKGLERMTTTTGEHNKWIATLQKQTLNASNGIMTKVKTAQSLMSYFAIKIKELLKKLFAVFMTMIYVMKTAEHAIVGMAQGPFALAVDDMSCFVGTTPIELNDGGIKYISEIEVGDVLLGDNKVIGVTKSYAPYILYKYNDEVIVSGSHLVYEDGLWVKIKEAVTKTEYNNEGEDRYEYIYNLVTANNTIQIYDTTYRDYCECSNSEINHNIRNYVLDSLNMANPDMENNHHKYDYKYDNKYDYKDYYLTGYESNTIVDMKDGIKKAIKDINTGEELKGVGKVTSIVRYECNNIENICMLNGIIMSGYNIVRNGFGRWCFAHDMGDKLTDKDLNNGMDIYSISTDKGTLHMGSVEFRDLNETYSDKTNSGIDNMIMSYLN